jgi:hypothetical protein
MSPDPTRLIVWGAEPTAHSRCSTWQVHHRDFPELRVEGGTPRQGVERLGQELSQASDWLCDPWRRSALAEALADVEAYLGVETIARP